MLNSPNFYGLQNVHNFSMPHESYQNQYLNSNFRYGHLDMPISGNGHVTYSQLNSVPTGDLPAFNTIYTVDNILNGNQASSIIASQTNFVAQKITNIDLNPATPDQKRKKLFTSSSKKRKNESAEKESSLIDEETDDDDMHPLITKKSNPEKRAKMRKQCKETLFRKVKCLPI